jgi:hypothetical protein
VKKKKKEGRIRFTCRSVPRISSLSLPSPFPSLGTILPSFRQQLSKKYIKGMMDFIIE